MICRVYKDEDAEESEKAKANTAETKEDTRCHPNCVVNTGLSSAGASTLGCQGGQHCIVTSTYEQEAIWNVPVAHAAAARPGGGVPAGGIMETLAALDPTELKNALATHAAAVRSGGGVPAGGVLDALAALDPDDLRLELGRVLCALRRAAGDPAGAGGAAVEPARQECVTYLTELSQRPFVPGGGSLTEYLKQLGGGVDNAFSWQERSELLAKLAHLHYASLRSTLPESEHLMMDSAMTAAVAVSLGAKVTSLTEITSTMRMHGCCVTTELLNTVFPQFSDYVPPPTNCGSSLGEILAGHYKRLRSTLPESEQVMMDITMTAAVAVSLAEAANVTFLPEATPLAAAPKRAKLEDRKFEFIKRGGPYRAVGVDTERCLERVLGPVEDGDYPGSWKRLEEAKGRAPEADRATVMELLQEMHETRINERYKCDDARTVLAEAKLRQEFFEIMVEDLQKILKEPAPKREDP